METEKVGNGQGAPVNWWILVSVGCGTFMSALDGSVVNTILPVLTKQLHAQVSSVEWVVTVYLLITSGLLLTAGRWGDLRGHKMVYLLGYAIFIAGSALCGLSDSVVQLVVSRGFQALGATLLFATSPAILTLNFPTSRRGQALGLQGTMTYLGIAVGPLLGGYLAAHFGWRSVFFINVPIGLLALVLGWRKVPRMAPIAKARGFELPGALFFFVGLTCLLLPLDQAYAWGWVSVRTIGTIALSIVLLTIFVLIELRTSDPMIDLRMFKSRTFSASTISSIVNFMGMSTMLFLIPYYLIAGRDFTPDRAGLLLVALPIPMAIVAPISGFLSDRIGTRLPAVAGMAIMASGCFMLTRLTPESNLTYLISALAIAGLGTGIFISPNNSALMGAATRAQQGVAAGVRATARNVGNVLGIGMAGAIFNEVMLQNHGLNEGISVSRGVDTGLLAAFIAILLGTAASAMQQNEKSTDRHASTAQLD